MIAIDDAVARVLARPAPVLIPDTCNFLDLFRIDPKGPRVPAEEIQVASELLLNLNTDLDADHFFVPELVPGEFADSAAKIAQETEAWINNQDSHQNWMTTVASFVGPPTSLAPVPVGPLHLHASLRDLAGRLLAEATAFERDGSALELAIARLIAKRRPSHKKEIGDSMNLEQVLLFCSRLRARGGTVPVAFISSNTSDYATTSDPQLHPALRAGFDKVSLEYFTSFRAAVGSIRTRGRLL